MATWALYHSWMIDHQYPLLYSFNDLVVGNGFVASVKATGRVLLVEAEEVWLHAVQPGSLAGGGDLTRHAAFTEFKNNYLGILFDIAAEAKSFVDFKKEVKSFFDAINEPFSEEWNETLAKFRARKNLTLLGLPVLKAESKPSKIEISLVNASRAKSHRVNDFDQMSAAVA